MLSFRRRFCRSAGLTLIELVIVMVVLATLAALVIPRLGFIQQQAVPLSGAAGSADLMSNLETFKTTTGYYPQGFDSLLQSGGAQMMTGLAMGPGGTPPTSPFTASDLSTIDSQGMALASFGMAFGPSSGSTGTSQYRVFDQPASSTGDPTSSFTSFRILSYSGGSAPIAIVDPTTTAGQSVWQAAYPASWSTGTFTQPTGVSLVAFGVGQNCNAIGTTMASAPIQTGQNPGVYARYFAVFAVYGTGYLYPGKAAELKAVLDSNFNTISTNIGLYRQAAPSDQ